MRKTILLLAAWLGWKLYVKSNGKSAPTRVGGAVPSDPVSLRDG